MSRVIVYLAAISALRRAEQGILRARVYSMVVLPGLFIRPYFALCMPVSPPMIMGGSVTSEARLSLSQPSASLLDCSAPTLSSKVLIVVRVLCPVFTTSYARNPCALLTMGTKPFSARRVPEPCLSRA